ncbi:MAG TPA: IPT/TIG domain-containing protein [Myxococcota bacterium]|nr:IPT/TIG domain-containing protein [Myxococcota bacterium]
MLLLLACGTSPYEDYWTGAGPTLSAVSPQAIEGLVGGQEVVLSGTGLSTARTVVIGQRNAEILSATEGDVTVVVPQQVGPGAKDVVVVTDEGYARASDSLVVEGPALAAQENEAVSLSLYRIDCPIDVGYYMGFLDSADSAFGYPYGSDLYWCGLEAGYVDAYGQISLGANVGFAGELAYVGSLWSLPAAGETHFRGPSDRPVPTIPFVYGPVAPDETIAVTTPRDWQRDLDVQAAMAADIEENYYWYDESHSEHGGPEAWFFGDDECYIDAVDVSSGSGDTLTLASAGPAGATGMWLGFVESEGDGAYTEELVTASARISVNGTSVIGEPSGAVMVYDDWSGFLLADAPGYYMGRSDLPPGVDYTVTRSRLGLSEELGEVPGIDELVVTFPPNLMSGALDIPLDSEFRVDWEAGSGDAIVIEFIVYDTGIDDPNYMTEVARLTAHAVDADGSFVFSPEVLGQLPEARQEVTEDYDLTGYWGELTVTRHQLTAVSSSDGDIVIDMVHAVNAPVGLISSF